jgi:uncharacterized membrane protein YtjA (UPF0391 family)
MRRLAFTFLAISLVAAVLGFTGIPSDAGAIAKFFALLFGLLSLGFGLLSSGRQRRGLAG